MGSNEHAEAMKNAEASLKMEGLIVTPQMRERCVEVLEGRATTEECLRQIAAKDPAVRDALASARIEGLEVTEHTERDVARILSGEATTEEVAREILSRPGSSPGSDK